MTEEQEKISAINKQKARKHFGLKGYKFILHHIDWRMKHENIERYILWLPEDLIIMDRSEHAKLHWTFDHDERCKKLSEAHKGIRQTEESKKKISESLKGKPTWNKGKSISDTHKQKVSEALMGHESVLKGKHWKLVNGERIYY